MGEAADDRRPTIAVSTGLLRGYWPRRETPADPKDWAAPLALLADLGTDQLEFSQFWGPLDQLSDDQTATVASVVGDLGLRVVGASLVGIDLRLPERELLVSRVSTAIERVAALGGQFVSVGLHPLRERPLTPSQAPPYPAMTQPDVQAFVEPLRRLAAQAARAGVRLTLEMHEQTLLHRSDHVRAILDAVGSAGLGSNPDLGNLIRATGPLAEACEETMTALAPTTNYWHVKNGIRVEIGPDTYRSAPSPLASGFIDYRACLQIAVAAGFHGPLVIEHNGGDVFANARDAVIYLRELIGSVT